MLANRTGSACGWASVPSPSLSTSYWQVGASRWPAKSAVAKSLNWRQLFLDELKSHKNTPNFESPLKLTLRVPVEAADAVRLVPVGHKEAVVLHNYN
jgi:hypothetical protein